ncbi:MAG: RDD family protein [Pseudomonadota bacterium]
MQNPYAATQSPVADRYRLMLDAGLWCRLTNFLVDVVFVLIASSAFVFIVMVVLWMELPHYTYFEVLDIVPFEWLFGLNLLLYYAVCERRFGVTVGKMMSGTRVVNEQGGSIDWRQSIIRTVCRLIPCECLSIFFSQNKRCWHDILSGTKVVTSHA